jgi:hypothetical protein
MDASRFLVAGGLALWIGGLVAAAAYISRRMRFPKSRYARDSGGAPGWLGAIAGLILYAVTAFAVPTVAWVFTLFATGVVAYAIGVYVIALTTERRRAIQRGLPEPGTEGSLSVAEFAVFLSIAVPFAVAALALTVYGIANEAGGNRGEGGAALGLGAIAWFIAVPMAFFASPLLLVRRRH